MNKMYQMYENSIKTDTWLFKNKATEEKYPIKNVIVN